MEIHLQLQHGRNGLEVEVGLLMIMLSSWGLSVSNFMSPYMTDVPPTAVATSTASPCAGSPVTFDASTSTNAIG